MDTYEGQFSTRSIVDYVLTLQETVSLPPGSPGGTPTPLHYLFLAIPRNVIDQQEIGRLQVTDAGTERTIHDPLEGISYPTSAHVS